VNVTQPILRGIIVRDEDDKIIVQATQPEVERFARQRRGVAVDMRPATLRVRVHHDGLQSPATWQDHDGGPVGVIRLRGNSPIVLYNDEGLPVAIVRDVQQHSMPIEVTSHGNVMEQFISGGLYLSLTADGLPGVRVE
jgi:hypothetical protein